MADGIRKENNMIFLHLFIIAICIHIFGVAGLVFAAGFIIGCYLLDNSKLMRKVFNWVVSDES